ncbi:stage II sporulation protein M [Sphingomonas sp. CGMCC 1.13654]|uniref:Stage II sporulation protein M n=1 Tax=Sphingomonas chungangi TaxID=2683589 RepID=A0A838L1W8_9SPHN|nr:stage II sporulation protein M [Sphingomonas chungangi]MBA2933184.1 stage II sporulation protein M [Sphingomonas chungangi]MVW57856.1 stage II sporulation protein M [Sphingomonas chungangi]
MAFALPFRRKRDAHLPDDELAHQQRRLDPLPSAKFRAEREGDWRRLEELLNRAERRSAAVLTDDELLALPTLYRATVSALAVARETLLDRALIDYLEGLSTRAYFFLYGVRGRIGPRLKQFFRHDWPAAVLALWKETLGSLLLLVAGALAGYMLVRADSGWFMSLVGGMSEGRTPDSTTQQLRDVLYDSDTSGLEALASFLFTHNAQISLMCFALGFLFAVPSAILILMNGLTLGAFLALYADHHIAGELVGWLCVHGTTEMFAITLAGAAGIRIGWAVAFPGRLSRLDGMAAAGRQSGTVMAGVVVMLFVAALLEGFIRQLVTTDWLRFLIGGSMLTLWLAYFYGPAGRRR